MSKIKKTGTREWSEHSFNCVKGCSHGCLYCFGRDGRFNKKRGANWTSEETYNRQVKKFPGVVMFPTIHDFTYPVGFHCVYYLRALLAKGNRVLVVTKSDTSTVAAIVLALLDYPREQSEIRFTLSQFSVEIGKFWEPGAPDIKRRMAALFWAYGQGVRTSVSCEPWLDTHDALYALVAVVSSSVTETIWIGHANKLRKRCSWCMTPELDAAIKAIEARQTPEAARAVYEALKVNPKVRWKDSYQAVLKVNSEGRPL